MQNAARTRRPRPQNPRRARPRPAPVAQPISEERRIARNAAPPRKAPPGARSLVVAAQQSSLMPMPVRGLDKQQREAYVVEASEVVGEIQPFKTTFFESIREVRARAISQHKKALPAKQTLAQIRGYSRDDLMAIAEIAYHYLFNGGAKLALTLYEGLVAVAPDEPYFALALGLTFDHLEERKEALYWYKKAGELDPTEGRADINRAELYLEVRRYDRAKPLLAQGLAKARARGESDLEKKAQTLLNHLSKLG